MNALALRWFFQQDAYVKELVKWALHDRIERMAANYARRCRGQVDKDDLYQCGMIGLTKSLDSFAPAKGDYEPYALRYVRGEMLHFIRDASLTIKIPGSVKEAGWKITQFTAKFREENGRDPDVSEIASALGLSIDRTAHCIAINQRQKTTESLDDHLGSQANLYGQAVVGASLELSPAADLYRRALRMRQDGATATQIGRALQIGRPKVVNLLKHIDAELGLS